MKLPRYRYAKLKNWIIFPVALVLFAGFLVRVFQQAEVQQRYGFRVGSPRIGGIYGCEVIMITHIRTNGAFDKAGMGRGDILINHHRYWSMEKFLKETLDQPKGTKVAIEMIPFDCHNDDCNKILTCEAIRTTIVAP